MSAEMACDAINYTKLAYMLHSGKSYIAKYVAVEFEKKYGQKWHCIIGPDFGAYVGHDPEMYICFENGEHRVLLFKS
jgi:dynein light chain LC8-type